MYLLSKSHFCIFRNSLFALPACSKLFQYLWLHYYENQLILWQFVIVSMHFSCWKYLPLLKPIYVNWYHVPCSEYLIPYQIHALTVPTLPFLISHSVKCVIHAVECGLAFVQHLIPFTFLVHMYVSALVLIWQQLVQFFLVIVIHNILLIFTFSAYVLKILSDFITLQSF